jgi:two-component SAPR family response regulator
MIEPKMQGFMVLVVEDEMLIALDIEAALLDLGCEVKGPIAGLKEALSIATTEALDAAILDITIRDELVYPVAEKLLERNIPFVLASGYGQWALPEPMRVHPRLIKPFTTKELEAAMWGLFNDAAYRKSHVE